MMTRKFDAFKSMSKKRSDRALYMGEVLSVVGISHQDERRRTYYRIKRPYSNTYTAVRSDRLTAIA